MAYQKAVKGTRNKKDDGWHRVPAVKKASRKIRRYFDKRIIQECLNSN